MTRLPAIFVSHGAPDLPLRQGAAQNFLRSLHQQFAKPKAILIVSAHWNSDPPMVSIAAQPTTLYDFGGFPPALYQLRYPAPGAPDLGHQVVALLTEVGIPCQVHASRGLDHGAWTPLLLAYPAADIPVTQLSIQYNRDPFAHWTLGRALEPLRDEGVLIMGSGSATHNLYALEKDYNTAPPDWVQEFDQWLAQSIQEANWEALMQYRQLAPYAKKNHPTEEHLLPLFVALGAAGTIAHGKQLHRSYTYGVLSMAAYAFM